MVSLVGMVKDLPAGCSCTVGLGKVFTSVGWSYWQVWYRIYQQDGCTVGYGEGFTSRMVALLLKVKDLPVKDGLLVGMVKDLPAGWLHCWPW